MAVSPLHLSVAYGPGLEFPHGSQETLLVTAVCKLLVEPGINGRLSRMSNSLQLYRQGRESGNIVTVEVGGERVREEMAGWV